MAAGGHSPRTQLLPRFFSTRRDEICGDMGRRSNAGCVVLVGIILLPDNPRPVLCAPSEERRARRAEAFVDRQFELCHRVSLHAASEGMLMHTPATAG